MMDVVPRTVGHDERELVPGDGRIGPDLRRRVDASTSSAPSASRRRGQSGRKSGYAADAATASRGRESACDERPAKSRF